ncbi:MAG: hypothetical protein RLZZ02_209 [Bacteroidota bacterium]|jgi:short-subunit dehydrogenase
MVQDKSEIWVTGCAQGIGHATCKLLLDKGYRVLGMDIRTPAQEILQHHHFEFVELDLCSEEFYSRWVSLLQSKQPAGIIHSAGLGSMGAFGQIDLVHELRVLDLNVKATLKLLHGCTQALDPKKACHIIVLSSTAGRSLVPGMSVYSASKHFVSALALSLMHEWRIQKRPWRLSTLTPPPVRTSFRENMGLEERKKPIRGVLMPEAVAADIVWVLDHPQQNRITGWWQRISFQYLRPLIPKRILAQKIYETSLFDLRPKN